MTEQEAITAIRAATKSGNRVLIIPVKGGVRLFVIKREEIKTC